MDTRSIYDDVLAAWQRDAVDAWERGDSAPNRGTLEIFTGGGKTLMALAAFQRARLQDTSLKLAVVVPTTALLDQWFGAVQSWLGLEQSSVGRLGGGYADALAANVALVAVINSAAEKLPELADGHRVLLVVDECHRAGAPSFAMVLDTPAVMRMGLSATPERTEVDEDGLPVEFDDQIVGKRLGRIVYRFGLREARKVGWLPDYRLHHHGVVLTPEERRDYEAVSRRIQDLQDLLSGGGVSRAQALSGAGGRDADTQALITSLRGATSKRKDLLYRSAERDRVARQLLGEIHEREPSRKVIVFHERQDLATGIYRDLAERFGQSVALEHSGLPDKRRKEAMQGFRGDDVSVLVSVKTLIEGLDVPDASVGMSVASSASVRQRVQSLGRVLRRNFDPDRPKDAAEIHLLYVRESVDERVYEGEDWEDLTGHDANRYLLWDLAADDPRPGDGPPRSPKPTEDDLWDRLGDDVPTPVQWPGLVPEEEFSLATSGAVTSMANGLMANPQDVDAMVRAVRGEPSGRFRVTPKHRYVLVGRHDSDEFRWYVTGRLAEPFRRRGVARGDEGATDLSMLSVGDPLPEHVGKAVTYQLRQRGGGMIERKQGRLREAAIVDDSEQGRAAREILAAWRSLGIDGTKLHISDDGVAWCVVEGAPTFLVSVPQGLAYESDRERGQGQEPEPDSGGSSE